MTAQISDIATYSNTEYDIVGLNGEGLFNPYEYKLNPVGSCTACWRGYMVGYLVKDDRLYADMLRINLEKPAKLKFWKKWPPDINGHRPDKPGDADFELFDYTWSNLQIPLTFTGGLLLGNDFIHDLYVHMGFQDPWKYREVHEFVFDKGKLTKHQDVSEKMKQYRDMVEKGTGSPKGYDSLEAWINDCFSLSYRI